MSFLVSFLIVIVIALLVFWLLLRVAKKAWYLLHDIAGIDPRPIRYQHSHLIAHHPNEAIPTALHEQELLHPAGMTLTHPSNTMHPNTLHQSQASLSKYWHVKHGKVTPLTYLPSITAEKINEMPSEALVILDRINDKIARYTAWREEVADMNETWLTEKQYAINRLINESIPEAVNHFDQLARFDPHRVQHTKINGDMTASDILIDVLQEVDSQLDHLIDELYQQTVQKLASMHRYVKTRVQ